MAVSAGATNHCASTVSDRGKSSRLRRMAVFLVVIIGVFVAGPLVSSSGFATPVRGVEQVRILLNAAGEPITMDGENFSGSSPLRCRLSDGRAGVLKLDRPRNDEERRSQKNWWAHQVISSFIMARMGCHAVEYREAWATHGGLDLRGIACEEILGMRPVSARAELLSQIRNPDRAILGAVVSAWLGDFDRIIKNENLWLDSQSEVIFGDFGCAGMDHVNVFGVIPKVNRSLFASQATPQNLEQALTTIRSLSDPQIRNMVNEGSRLLSRPRPEVLAEITSTLIRNRDELRNQEDWARDLIGPIQATNYTVPQSVANAILARVLERFSSPGANMTVVARRAVDGLPGYRPFGGLDRIRVQRELGEALLARSKGNSPELKLEPDCFYVWMQLAKGIFTTDESIQLGLGLKHNLSSDD